MNVENKIKCTFNRCEKLISKNNTSKMCSNHRNLTIYRENKEFFLAKRKEYYIKNRNKVIERASKQYRKDPEKNKKRINNWKNARIAVDPCFKIAHRLRTRLNHALGGVAVKDESVLAMLGCSLEEFKLHLEKQFQPGMNWQNHTSKGWHIDHINPLSSFDLTDIQQQRLAFHFSNCQPLWAKDNLSKGHRIIKESDECTNT